MKMRVNASRSFDARGLDQYWTPPEVVQAFLEIEDPPKSILDPCCGSGNILNVLAGAGHEVEGWDLEDCGYPGTQIRDMLATSFPTGWAIVTNPPYKWAFDFLQKALVDDGVTYIALLLRIGFLAAQSRQTFLEAHPATRIWVSSRRIDMHQRNWAGKKASSNMDFAWYVWDRRGPSSGNQIRHFDWQDLCAKRMRRSCGGRTGAGDDDPFPRGGEPQGQESMSDIAAVSRKSKIRVPPEAKKGRPVAYGMTAGLGNFDVLGFDAECNVIAFPNVPSAEVIAFTADELERTVISYRTQGRTLEQICEILSTAWENLHFHPARRREVEGYFNAPPKKEKIAVRSPQRGVEIDMAVSGLNSEWAVVIDGARTKVMRFVANEINGQIRQVAEFLSCADFAVFFMNRMIQTADAPPKFEPLGKLWLRHPARRQFSGLIFDPKAAREIGGKLNLWQGFAIEPAQGDWHRIKKHIREVIADKNEEAAEYTLNWLAFLFQYPEIPAEVALALIGGKGSGKGFFGNMLCRIFGQHSLHISSPGHLTGRFNAHQRDCCFLFADESYWYGNKLAAGALQRLITEPDLAIEGKGKDPITAPNRMHVLIAAEEGSVVPAGASERPLRCPPSQRKVCATKSLF